MNIVANTYFGIVTREGHLYQARVEVPGEPDVVLAAHSDDDLFDDVGRQLARLLGVEPDDVDLHLFGHDGGDGIPVYAGAAVFDGGAWLTQFPAQEDLPVALSVPPSPTYEVAADRARQALAAAVGRSGESLDIEFFEIVPHEHAASAQQEEEPDSQP
ncbi:hypothetical protein ACTWQF_35970 [Streptomyces sp. 8N114]|uniref:hypothetical protein n=1 Tax=Streptomyces sp. 8N114 TaxID=3457419 RepID=UPI003FD0F15E